MKVAVIGAGVAGITTAWEFARRGADVTVFEHLRGAAEATSFASTGLLAPSALAAWDLAAPAWPTSWTSSMLPPPQWLRRAQGFQWWRRMRRQRAPERQWELATLALSLGKKTQDLLHQLSNSSNLTPEVSSGLLVLMRAENDRNALRAGLDWLKLQGENCSELTSDDAHAIERALSAETPFVGAIRLQGEGVFNGRQWLSMLRNEAAKMGCEFAFNTRVLSVEANGKMLTRSVFEPATTREQRFEAVVLCSGSASSLLLEPLGMQLPTLLLDHCSVTAPVREPLDAPDSAVVDARHRVSISRTGQRVRVSSASGLVTGADATPTFKHLYKVLNDWFPGAARFSDPQGSVQEWRGTCSYMPDGLPAVGPTDIPGLWLNTAYGSRGWTLAPACAEILAARITCGEETIDISALAPSRIA